MEAAVLDADGLTVEIDTPNGPLRAVNDLSLSLRAGRSLGIVGESGSGKSMTALSLMRLLPKSARLTANRLRFGEEDLTALSDPDFAARIAGQRIGMIFQEPMTSLNPVYTIGRQLTEGPVRAGLMSQAQATARAIEMLDRTGLPEPEARMRQYPHQLSGGQRQRVMIAMALMTRPDLLLADEPTTALDVTVQAQILDLLRDIQRDLGMAMILITHDLAVVADTVDDVAVMYRGEIVEAGPVDAVLRDPCHPYTRALLRAAPTAFGARRRLGAVPGQIAPVHGQLDACVFAPRCPAVRPECRKARPPSRPGTAAGQSYACVLDPAEVAQIVRADSTPMPDSAKPGEPVIEAIDVRRVFESRPGLMRAKRSIAAVDGVSLQVRRGETFALVGESGSGKTTLSRILLGLDAPTSGSVRIAGRDLTELPRGDRGRLVQPVFQDPYSSLNPRRTIGSVITRPLVIQQIGDIASRAARLHAVMAEVGLPEAFVHNYPSQLSGGQRQRVAIARALVTEPQILVCDEPTSALDVSVQAQILNLLTDLKTRLGLTLFLVTHDIAVVHQMADRVAVMKDGRIVEQDIADRVLHAPSDPYTRALLEAVPRLAEERTPETAP
jgi:peptide/nickel transport system ATP-binding protein